MNVKPVKKVDPDTGIYVGVYLSPRDGGRLLVDLARYAPLLEIDRAAHEFHCTVMYSKNPIPNARSHVDWGKWSSVVSGVGLLGKDNDAIVLHLRSKAILKLHKKWMQLGAEHSYPEFKPHMTLKEGAMRAERSERSLHGLQFLVGRRLVFNKGVVTYINPDKTY